MWRSAFLCVMALACVTGLFGQDSRESSVTVVDPTPRSPEDEAALQAEQDKVRDATNWVSNSYLADPPPAPSTNKERQSSITAGYRSRSDSTNLLEKFRIRSTITRVRGKRTITVYRPYGQSPSDLFQIAVVDDPNSNATRFILRIRIADLVHIGAPYRMRITFGHHVIDKRLSTNDWSYLENSTPRIYASTITILPNDLRIFWQMLEDVHYARRPGSPWVRFWGNGLTVHIPFSDTTNQENTRNLLQFYYYSGLVTKYLDMEPGLESTIEPGWLELQQALRPKPPQTNRLIEPGWISLQQALKVKPPQTNRLIEPGWISLQQALKVKPPQTNRLIEPGWISLQQALHPPQTALPPHTDVATPSSDADTTRPEAPSHLPPSNTLIEPAAPTPVPEGSPDVSNTTNAPATSQPIPAENPPAVPTDGASPE